MHSMTRLDCLVFNRLLTIWRIEAPLKEVYAAIHRSPRWPDWWPGSV